MKPKQLPHPTLKSGRPLSKLEMNQFHFNTRHTVLTPEQLLAMTKAATIQAQADGAEAPEGK